jgi:ferrochelatase
MTPREFLAAPGSSRYASFSGAETAAVEVHPGDTVGVVLMNLGGPSRREEVEAFLYSRLMDPAEVTWRLPLFARHSASRWVARRRARALGEAYAQIGGQSPLARHTEEQARALERVLNDRFAAQTGARFRTYVAMRHAHPSSEEAAAAMVADGVTKVVHLPLHPHFARSTTGSSRAYWKALEASGEIPTWPSAFVPEYAAHPKYVRALSERIDEGLQRFPSEERERVQVVFSAHGALPVRPDPTDDPYCCLVHATVHQVMQERAAHDPRRSVHVAFQRPLANGAGLEPSVFDVVDDLAEQGHGAILVVPVSFVSDRVETAYELDVQVRALAEQRGVEFFEVSSGLNCHPLFIQALSECVAAQVLALGLSRGDGAASTARTAFESLPRHDAAAQSLRCATCSCVVHASDWEHFSRADEPVPSLPVPAPCPDETA